MRDLAILSFVTLDGVMQSPTSPEEDPSGGFAGWRLGGSVLGRGDASGVCGGDVGSV